MFLFTEHSKERILKGPKRVSRRRGTQRFRVGSEQLCYTGMPFARSGAKPFAKVRIIRREEDARG